MRRTIEKINKDRYCFIVLVIVWVFYGQNHSTNVCSVLSFCFSYTVGFLKNCCLYKVPQWDVKVLFIFCKDDAK